MDPKRATLDTIRKHINILKTGKGDPSGMFLFKGYRVHICKHNQSVNQRVGQLYERRRIEGLCIRCGAKVKEKNPRTNQPYRMCKKHR